MASSKRVKRILTQGNKMMTSTASSRTRPILENDGKIVDSDDSQEEGTIVSQSSKQDKRPKMIRPNAFLSLRITNQQIIDHATNLQKEIIETNPLLSKASVSIPTLHITLMVFALKTEDDKQRARQSLVDVCHQIALANLSSPQITFTGLSHFNNQVLYIDPVKDTHLEQLTRIAEICRDIYEKNGLMNTDTRPFNPHLTLFKLSKARDLHRKGVKKIDPSWTSKYTNHYFGSETFRSIHLCNMLNKQTDGYYEIFDEQFFVNEYSVPMNLTEIDHMTVSMVPTSNEQQIAVVIDSSKLDESSPLLQHDRPMYEEAFSGLASFFPSSLSCCSIS